MGRLARYLTDAFREHCPEGWVVDGEVRVLEPELERRLGYRPQADVLLARADGSRRIWVELEISRADPVANHAKFATAHLFQPFAPGDAFVAMLSPHVSRGRANLAAHAIQVMRRLGIGAFQTSLLPYVPAETVKRLNHARAVGPEFACIDPARELDRIFSVCSPAIDAADTRVFLAGNVAEVLANVWQWNREIAKESARAEWGRRTVTYFVHDPISGELAPAKFCAYIAPDAIAAASAPTGMDIALYARIERASHRLDGHRARTHLEQGLGMRCLAPAELPGGPDAFQTWLARCEPVVTVHPSGPRVLVP